jgi:NADH-quinone oxidoreductase subunit E
MLTEEEKNEILEETRIYPYPGAACLDALKIVQRHRGWVTDEAVKDIAGILGLSADEVDGVATFYTRIYRRPVGRHVILVCDGISCMIMGYGSLADHLKKTLGTGFGETTDDGRFTLLPVSCLGCCDGAPAIMIDEDLFEKVTIEMIDALLDKYE